MADPDYGLTFRCLEDLDPLLTTVSGQDAMNQEMLHRVYTPENSLLSDPNALTLDARKFISKGIQSSDVPIIQSKIQACLLDSERIFKADVVVTPNGAANARTMTIDIRGVGARGPFSLTLLASELTVQILRS